jgi:hypothetical protein
MRQTHAHKTARSKRPRRTTQLPRPSKRLSYGSIYTTKLLRRGIDIERPRATSPLEQLSVADVMQPLAQDDGLAWSAGGTGGSGRRVGAARGPGDRRRRATGTLRR